MAMDNRTLARPRLSNLIAFSLMFGLSGPAWGQQVCAPRAAMIEGFRASYAEVPVASGLGDGGRIMEILASPAGTWTMLSVTATGMACLVITGTGWRGADPVVAGRDS